jgi:hypothetical protein
MEQQAMTREERRAERRALEARRATMAFVKHAAKRQLIAGIRARGARVSDYSNKQLTLAAEELLASNPELIVKGQEMAKQLGYGV